MSFIDYNEDLVKKAIFSGQTDDDVMPLNYIEKYINDNQDKIQKELTDCNNPHLLYFVGFYKFATAYDNDETLKILLKAYNCGATGSLSIIGSLYKIMNDYENMIKYLNIGVQHNDEECMMKLGDYYYEIEKNNDMAKQYYIDAINNCGDDIEFCGSCIYQLVDIMTPVSIYYAVKNQSVVLDYYHSLLDHREYDLLRKYIDDGKDSICQICFLNKYCTEFDGKNICVSCFSI